MITLRYFFEDKKTQGEREKINNPHSPLTLSDSSQNRIER
jgi:hypothetical protein